MRLGKTLHVLKSEVVCDSGSIPFWSLREVCDQNWCALLLLIAMVELGTDAHYHYSAPLLSHSQQAREVTEHLLKQLGAQWAEGATGHFAIFSRLPHEAGASVSYMSGKAQEKIVSLWGSKFCLIDNTLSLALQTAQILKFLAYNTRALKGLGRMACFNSVAHFKWQ